MFVRRKRYPSGNIGILVVEKVDGKMRELIRIGIATTEAEIAELEKKAQDWIYKEQGRRHPRLDLFGEESAVLKKEITATQRFLSNITNITLDGADLLLPSCTFSLCRRSPKPAILSWEGLIPARGLISPPNT